MTKNTNNLKQIIGEIISAIDLNYILAEAEQQKYQVCLMCGDLRETITWGNMNRYLSFNYEISTGIIYDFISKHNDKIIKLNIKSDDFIVFDRNIVIYVPYEVDIHRVKKECSSVVDLS
jgi:hypothetical protein